MSKTRDRDLMLRAKRIEQYMLTHDSIPECGCGCGLPVRFNNKGIPNTYLLGHKFGSPEAARAARAEACIPLADFQAAVRKIKEKKGYSWSQIADICGMSRGHMRSLMHDYAPGRRVNRWLARNMLLRLSGQAAEITTYQKRQSERATRAENLINKHYGLK